MDLKKDGHPTFPESFVGKVKLLRSKNISKLPETGFFPDINKVLRDYQKTGVANLVSIPRMILGDDTGLGKTVMSLAALSILFEKKKISKVVIVTLNSALFQWEKEIHKFTKGLSVEVLGAASRGTGSIRDRVARLKKTKADIILMPYSTFSPKGKPDLSEKQELFWKERIKYKSMRPKYRVEDILLRFIDKETLVIFDEITYLKNPTSKRSKSALVITQRSKRVWGLTATITKNNAFDVYGAYKVVCPPLFPTKKFFEKNFVKMAKVPWCSYPTPVGFKNLDLLRKVIDPVYISRRKKDVAKELPEVLVMDIVFKMNKTQKRHYDDIQVDEVIEFGDSRESRLVTPLTAIAYKQMVVDHPLLLGIDAQSTKLQLLLDKLEMDWAGKKLVIFSRYEKMITILADVLGKEGYSVVRITGKESSEKRRSAIQKFTKSKGQIICLLTEAGSEAINLQVADTLVFYDLPFSFGIYYQTIGRVHRIGSDAEVISVYHFIGEKTVDEYMYKLLNEKWRMAKTVSDVKGSLFDDATDDVAKIVAQKLYGNVEGRTDAAS